MSSAWWSLGLIGAALAADAVTTAGTGQRTLDNLPGLAWAFLIGWAFAGWIISSLRTAVMAMNDVSQPGNVRAALIISTLVASIAFGVICGLYLLTEARWDGKPLGALYAYIGAFFGGFLGMKGMEFVIDTGKGILDRWAAGKGKT